MIESYSSGRAFGRIDLTITGTRVTGSTIHKPGDHVSVRSPRRRPSPRSITADHDPIAVADCHPAPYEGKPVVPDPQIQKIVDDALAHAGARRGEKLGVTLASTITKSYKSESALGDWFADLMLAAMAEHGEVAGRAPCPASSTAGGRCGSIDIALTNAGGLRADLPEGELTYGQLFAAMPFGQSVRDRRGSRQATCGTSSPRTSSRSGGIFSWAGLSAKARCKAGALDVEISVAGKPLADDATYRLVTSDFPGLGRRRR